VSDENMLRFAQTPVGRVLVKWSEMSKKQKRKRRFPVVTVVFLGLFTVMLALSLLDHSSASAVATRGTQASMLTQGQSVASNSTYDLTQNARGAAVTKCLDGSAPDSKGLCDPATFDLGKCPVADAGDPQKKVPIPDECNPWGQSSTQADPAKAREWASLRQDDRACIQFVSKNSDINLRYVGPEAASAPMGKGGDLPKYNTGTCKGPKVGSGWFPCAQDEATISGDWLSGDVSQGGTNTSTVPGHLQTTYRADTLENSNVSSLYGFMEALGLVLLGPTLILAGYQILVSASSFRYAEAITSLSRVLLAGVAVVACYGIISMMLDFSNQTSFAVVDLHKTVSYPAPQPIPDTGSHTLDASYYIGYTLAVGDAKKDASNGSQQATDGTISLKEPATSYRGVVVPINRWGCAGNDFISIVSNKFWTNVFASFIPFFGNFISMTDKITSAVAVVHHLGEFVATILSIGLAAQIVFRIVMLNFYILMGPVACGCWGLPGGTGQHIIGQWFRGFCSLLFAQAGQLFVLSVTPLIFPDLANLALPTDSMGLLKSVFSMLPVIIVLYVTLRLPRMMGTSAASALASAGTMASGAVAATGAAIYSMV